MHVGTRVVWINILLCMHVCRSPKLTLGVFLNLHFIKAGSLTHPELSKSSRSSWGACSRNLLAVPHVLGD